MSVSTIDLRKYIANKLPSKPLKNIVLNKNPECVIENAICVASLLEDLRKPQYMHTVSSKIHETITRDIAEYLPFNVKALHVSTDSYYFIKLCPLSALPTSFQGDTWLYTIIMQHPMTRHTSSRENYTAYLTLYIYTSLVVTLYKNHNISIVHYLKREGIKKEHWRCAQGV